MMRESGVRGNSADDDDSSLSDISCHAKHKSPDTYKQK